MVTVRPATVAHAAAMGQLVVRAWQAAYRGQMPDDYLNGLRAEDRAAYWDGVLRREDRRGVILVAERDGEVVGFAAAGLSPDPKVPGSCTPSTSTPTTRAVTPAGPCSEPPRRGYDRMGFAESVLWSYPQHPRPPLLRASQVRADGTRRPARPLGQLQRGPLPRRSAARRSRRRPRPDRWPLPLARAPPATCRTWCAAWPAPPDRRVESCRRITAPFAIGCAWTLARLCAMRRLSRPRRSPHVPPVTTTPGTASTAAPPTPSSPTWRNRISGPGRVARRRFVLEFRISPRLLMVARRCLAPVERCLRRVVPLAGTLRQPSPSSVKIPFGFACLRRRFPLLPLRLQAPCRHAGVWGLRRPRCSRRAATRGSTSQRPVPTCSSHCPRSLSKISSPSRSIARPWPVTYRRVPALCRPGRARVPRSCALRGRRWSQQPLAW